MTREEAIVALLGMPDEPGLHRGHHRTQPRKGDPDAIKRDLGTAYVTWQRQEHTDGDISCVVSVRRQPRLRVAGLRIARRV